MPEIRPSPRRPDPEKDKKHQEESRRQARFSISYLLVSLFFSVVVSSISPDSACEPEDGNRLQRFQEETCKQSNRGSDHRRQEH